MVRWSYRYLGLIRDVSGQIVISFFDVVTIPVLVTNLGVVLI